MDIVLSHTQRLVLRRIASFDTTLPPAFVQLVPNATAIIRRQYRIALDFLVQHGFVQTQEDSSRIGVVRYTLTLEGRRQLYPRALRGDK